VRGEDACRQTLLPSQSSVSGDFLKVEVLFAARFSDKGLGSGSNPRLCPETYRSGESRRLSQSCFRPYAVLSVVAHLACSGLYGDYSSIRSTADIAPVSSLRNIVCYGTGEVVGEDF